MRMLAAPAARQRQAERATPRAWSGVVAIGGQRMGARRGSRCRSLQTAAQRGPARPVAISAVAPEDGGTLKAMDSFNGLATITPELPGERVPPPPPFTGGSTRARLEIAARVPRTLGR